MPAEPFAEDAAAADLPIGSGLAGGPIAASDEKINLQVMIPAQVQTSGRRLDLGIDGYDAGCIDGDRAK